MFVDTNERSDEIEPLGKLDIASMELERIPHEVYVTLLGIPLAELTNPPPKADTKTDVKGMSRSFSSQLRLAESTEDKSKVFGKGGKEEEVWIEGEEVTSWKGSGNQIEGLEREIGGFGGLKSFDVSIVGSNISLGREGRKGAFWEPRLDMMNRPRGGSCARERSDF